MQTDWFHLILSFAVFQGVFFLFALLRLQGGNRAANRVLASIVLFITLTMLGRLLGDSWLLLQYPRMLVFPDAVIFLYGPLFWLYVRVLLLEARTAPRALLLHAIPAILYMVVEASGVLMENGNILSVLFPPDFWYWGAIAEGAAIVLNIMYLLFSYRTLRRWQQIITRSQPDEAVPTYLYGVITGIGLVLLFWTYAWFSWVFAPSPLLGGWAYRAVWIAFSFIIHTIAYFALRQPAVLRLPQTSVKRRQKKLDKQSELEEAQRRLSAAVNQHKPYLDQTMTLNKLADIADIKSHILSRLINERYGVNFAEFINAHRIEEFQRLVRDPEKQQLTILALAYEAGFNSKTTFNTVFKKHTGVTPRAWIKQDREKHESRASQD